ncbi:hypothetical protein [Piscibacillus salipiscarius]|uniref:Uncharacterized protein n=1 Tax=Piscibacillus salipiscarius TaxID=299480 RepID=A0ABW5QBQ4_9BACI|nr:hypothetical protein [Piscibacillus salipiscarius]
MKKSYLALTILLMIVIVGCTNNEVDESQDNEEEVEVSQEENNAENNTSEESNLENEEAEENEETENEEEETEEFKADAAGYEISSGDKLNVEIVGETVIFDNQLQIAGKTNLPGGARIHIAQKPIGDVTFMGTSGYASIESDGTFKYEKEIPEDYKDHLKIAMTFKPSVSNGDIKDVYGELGEKLEGPFVRKGYGSDEYYKEAFVEVYHERNKDGSLSKAEIPIPSRNKPDDYGDLNIRMDANLDYDDNYVYINGTSNLIEGNDLRVLVNKPSGSRSGMSEFVTIKPDGSFNVIFKNKSKDGSLKDYKLLLKFSISSSNWPDAIEKYGENGENLNGELVEEQSDGDRIAEKEITIKE